MDGKEIIAVIAVVVIVLAAVIWVMRPGAPVTILPSQIELSCTGSGGNVSTGLCCGSASDFPNSCLIGACGCAPTSSHEVKTCQCPEASCFNGTACVNREALMKEQDCIASGGNVTTAMCCGSVGDFPNSCLIGACGCSPTASHEVKSCNCGSDSCFNGTACVNREALMKEAACAASGGNVTTRTCCTSATDFPIECTASGNQTLLLVGPCGCGPSGSEPKTACDCGANKCWDGTACIAGPA